MSGYIQSNILVNLPDADLTLTSCDSGKIFAIPTLTADRTYRLPFQEKGLHLTFVNSCGAATLGNIAIIDQREVGNNIYGVLLNTPAAVVSLDDEADVEFLGISVKGDYIDCLCDGNRWYVSGMSGVVGLGNA